jgi:hypothetical protein
MNVGDFVQLLDIDGKPLEGFYGIITKTESGQWAQVYWHSGGYNGLYSRARVAVGSTMWALKRLKVVSDANR